MMATIFSTVGAVVASRRPDHPVGWLFCAVGLIGGLRLLGTWYIAYTLLTQHGPFLGGWVALWLSSWVWVPHVGLFVYLVLLFPDGRLPSSRWRPFAWLVAVVVVTGTVAVVLSPGAIGGLEPIENPLGIEGAPNIIFAVETLMYGLGGVAALSVLVRLHHARGTERQQIKWFAYAAGVLTICTLIAYVLPEVANLQWLHWVSFVPTMLALVGLPVALGIAILKYRLYDIDRIINRTLVYGSLTAMLALVYFGGVTVTQALLRTLTGQEKLPQLVIVASTLVIAALFNPLRRRIQSFIDRSFYRKKYDARKTLETFSLKLRDETDLEALNNDLVGVVRETMQPAYVSLWLRPETVSKKGGQTD
jgi:hypothetical protein